MPALPFFDESLFSFRLAIHFRLCKHKILLSKVVLMGNLVVRKAHRIDAYKHCTVSIGRKADIVRRINMAQQSHFPTWGGSDILILRLHGGAP